MPLKDPDFYARIALAYGYAINGWEHVVDTTAHTGNFCAVMALDASLSLDSANTIVSSGNIAGDIPLPQGAIIPGPFTKLALKTSGNALFFYAPPEAFGNPG